GSDRPLSVVRHAGHGAVILARPAQGARIRPVRVKPARLALHAFLTLMVALWLFPLLWAIYTALRPIADTTLHGYFSWTTDLKLENFTSVWSAAHLPFFYWNTLVIVVPGVVLTLLVASMVAFALTQFSWKLNLIVLMLFTAGNLLPPQVIIVPLYRLYLSIPIPIEFLSDNGLLYDQ